MGSSDRSVLGVRVHVSELRVWAVGFGVEGLGLRGEGTGFRV